MLTGTDHGVTAAASRALDNAINEYQDWFFDTEYRDSFEAPQARDPPESYYEAFWARVDAGADATVGRLKYDEMCRLSWQTYGEACWARVDEMCRPS